MSGYIISEEDQATLECARELACLIACQVRNETPPEQMSAFAHTVYVQLRDVLSRARLSFDVEA